MTTTVITPDELKNKLVALEVRKKEVRKQKKSAMVDFKDQLGEIDVEIDSILFQLEEAKGIKI